MESCGMNIIKYLLFIFNLIFALSGIAIIVAGAVILSDTNDFGFFEEEGNLGPAIVLIVAGSIVFIVAFLGCFGAIRENYKMLMAFAVLLLIIFIIEMAAGIAAAVNQKELSSDKFRASMDKYKDNGKDKIAWDNLQNKLSCCGINGPSDWGANVPSTCCRSSPQDNEPPNPFCVSQGKGNNYLSTSGCLSSLNMGIKNNGKALIGIGIGIPFIEIIGIVLACWLASVIKKESVEKA